MQLNRSQHWLILTESMILLSLMSEIGALAVAFSLYDCRIQTEMVHFCGRDLYHNKIEFL